MNQNTGPEVSCPGCSRVINWNENWPERPFCSRRCRDLDFGAWANESYRIPGEPAWIDEEDDETGTPDDDDFRLQ
ncbi:hypothetical protein DES49_1028 [Halospina denitrificans]|uniref:DNA gyrase inhibitor YacG n=1 Tax=Halospina denitrificans TaxID=332522 RepID=A0A4R7JZ29_9GAMM|nr:DNA gyrase inhibitor YacG [Halospina denitrificans]TDT43214.1 hypothetical protein DES49_1028 [Halospina denitrificans]